MGREKRNVPAVASGAHAKERHKRDRKGNLMDWTAPVPAGLVARPERPRVSSKHKSWFEFIENKDKKKKLEFEFTEKREPPPGFEFVPIGNPALTTACKELSREQGAMIFIVTSSHGYFSKRLSLHLNRAGHHIRQTIVEQARASLGDNPDAGLAAIPGQPEPIPERQEDINKQADAAIRDLFPRIPNTDRQMIIEHAFNKLAVLAHIRHNHTRYDQLLKETSYVNARKAVESLCLDFLVKWRGDEETGRDQLDEILCEVIVISDSESEDDDEEDDEDDEESSDTSSGDDVSDKRPSGEGLTSRATLPPVEAPALLNTGVSRGEGTLRAAQAPQGIRKVARRDRREAKWAQRGFGRYQAARDQAWHQAVERQRLENNTAVTSARLVSVDGPASPKPQLWPSGEPGVPTSGRATVRSRVESSPRVQPVSYATPLPPRDARYERGSAPSRVHDVQQTIPMATYRMPEGTGVQGDPRPHGLEPVVGSHPLSYGAPEVERVSYRGQDLKDHLVQSIEPASPNLSSVPSRFPVLHLQHDPDSIHVAEGYSHAAVDRRVPAGRDDKVTAAQDFHTICAEEGFVRLPPRPDPSRVPVAHEPRDEPFILVRSRPLNTARVDSVPSTSDGSGARYSSAHYGNAAYLGDRPVPKSGPRPSWIGEDGVILRSESRPILIPDHQAPFRFPPAEPVYHSSKDTRPSPTRRVTDARDVGSRWMYDGNGALADPRMERRIETLQDDFVEIVRVSNKFPRQHEPHAAPARPESYNLRPAATLPIVSHQVPDGTALHDPRQFPTQGQPFPRRVDWAEQSGFRQQSSVARHPHGYRDDLHRQERVVGIEYVPVRPSLEARTYSERRPLYEAGDHIHRSRSASIIPLPYPGPASHPSHPQAGRPVPRRDEVITLD